jgi:hypothetical protein
MLREVKKPRQNDGERRRIFFDEFFDLYLWMNNADGISGFQLCYDKRGNERAMTWREDAGYSHTKVDDGEPLDGGYKMKPILVADGLFQADTIAEKFKLASETMPDWIADFVYERISKFTLE